MALTLLLCAAVALAAEPSPGNGTEVPAMPSKSRFTDFLKWRWQRLFADIPGPEAYHFPLAANDPAFLRGNRTKNTLTWIGHATLLLQAGGKNILTDPHFSKRASPVQWAGPQRVAAPGIALDDLPAIDIVIISHDHYDSLDTQTVRLLAGRPGGEQTRFFVPLGLKRWFTDLGISRVTELAWWQSHGETGLTVTAVPAQHWSKRRLFGKDDALWCGWVVAAGDFRFLFVGDSGYSPIFKEIGRRLGLFDLAAIPIGAYEPRWFMKRHHVNPEEAVQVHLDVGAGKSVAMHWGTFILTDEPLDEPPGRLKQALVEKGLAPESFIVLRHGETIFLGPGDAK
jgi:L-ascorbate metabolism protein UlaG (beta-lactamase superfamily)